MYDYERVIFDSLVTQKNGNTSSYGKHLWIKKQLVWAFQNLCFGLWPGFV